MNVNVSYNGFSLADAASCVMMRLPVPDLVWDMEALWKVWNEPLPAVDVSEAVPTDAQEEAEPVNQEAAKAVIAELEEHIRRQMPSRAKPVTYNGVTYESVYDCAAAFDLSADAVRWRLKHSLPLEAAYNFRRMVTYDGRAWLLRELAEHCGVNPRTIARRLRKGGDPAISGHCGRMCEYGGKRYASVTAMARELEINWKNALVLVESEGRWL